MQFPGARQRQPRQVTYGPVSGAARPARKPLTHEAGLPAFATCTLAPRGVYTRLRFHMLMAFKLVLLGVCCMLAPLALWVSL